MRKSALLCCAILLVGCAKADTAADTAAAVDTAMPAAAAEPTPISLDQLAGKWNVRITSAETGDSLLTSYVLDAKADTAGWTFQFPTGAPIAMKFVSMAGDSLVTQAGPFDSRLQKNVKVHSIVRCAAHLHHSRAPSLVSDQRRAPIPHVVSLSL